MKQSDLIEKRIQEAAEWHRKADHAYKINCRQDSPVLLLIKANERLLQVVQDQQAQINCLLTMILDGDIDVDKLRSK